MTAKRLKSLLLVIFLTISALISQLSVAQVGTAVFRQKINQELPSNNAKAITASKLRSVFNASANAIDEILNTVSIADGLGTYNASTGVATIKETGATFTPVSVASQANGKYFDVVTAGTNSITGSSVNWQVGDKLISRGTKWDRIPASDLALRITSNQNNDLDSLYKIGTGIVKKQLPLSMTFYRYDGSGGIAAGSNMGIVVNLNRTAQINGYTDNTQDGYPTFIETGIPNVLSFKKIAISAQITSFQTSNPCIGIGFEVSGSKVGYVYRKDGSLVLAKPNSVSILRSATAGLAYVATDVVTVEIVNTAGVLTILTSKNGVYASSVSTSEVPTGGTLIAMRGSATFSFSVATYSNSETLQRIQDARDYADALSSGLQESIDEVQDQVTIQTSGYAGRPSPSAGVASGTDRTRIDATPIPILSGTLKPTSLVVWCAVAGAGKIVFLSKNVDGIHFDMQHEYDYTFSVGQNTVPVSIFGTLTLQSGWYVGFKGIGSTQFSDIVGPSNSSHLLIGAYTNTPSASSYLLQYKLEISSVVDLKGKLLENTDLITEIGAPAFYVSDSTGSDSNDGLTEATSFKTINKALSSCVGKLFTTIIVAGGDYYETLNTSLLVSGRTTITAKNKERVRVMGSTKLSGWVKTAGYTNIYEASFAGTVPPWTHPPGVLPSIFEDKNPSKPVSANQVHALQKGLSYRLPYTQIPAVATGASLAATLTMMDGIPGSHYVSGGKLYLHASLSTSPLTNGFEYHVPVRASNVTPVNTNTSARGHLLLENLQFCFSTSGFISSGFALVGRINCTVLGIVDISGGWRDDAAHVISYKDEAGGCSNDGFNQHYDAYNADYATQNVRRGVGLAFYFDPWAHDNKDDGMSCHPRSEVTVHGGLSEYNGDGGYVPANGGTYRIYNALSRNNQLESDATQAGFGTANSATGTGRNHTTLLCHGCISEGDKVGFQNNSESGSVVDLYNCIARESTTANYSVTTSGAIMNANNSKSTHTNSSKHKSVVSGGILNVINDAVLTP